AMEKIAAFCRAGGTVIATRRLPNRVYGLHQEGATGRLRALIGEFFGQKLNGTSHRINRIDRMGSKGKGGSPHALHQDNVNPVDPVRNPLTASITVHAYGKGRALFTPDEREGLSAALEQAAVGPDLRVSPFQMDVGHVH